MCKASLKMICLYVDIERSLDTTKHAFPRASLISNHNPHAVRLLTRAHNHKHSHIHHSHSHRMPKHRWVSDDENTTEELELCLRRARQENRVSSAKLRGDIRSTQYMLYMRCHVHHVVYMVCLARSMGCVYIYIYICEHHRTPSSIAIVELRCATVGADLVLACHSGN